MNDFLYRGLFNDLNIRFSYALTTSTAETALKQHDYDPITGHMASRALTAAVLCSPQLTDDEKYNMQWAYEGAAAKTIIDVTADAKVRGYISGGNLMGRVESENEIYGDKGSMSVIKTNSKIVLSSSTSEAMLLDHVDDLCFFFCVSNQIETDIYCAVGFQADPEHPVEVSQGFLLQAMPDCDYEVLEKFRKRLKSDGFKALMAKVPENDNTFELLIKELALDLDEAPKYEIHACPEPEFKCSCSKEKTFAAVRTLQNAEIQELVDKEQTIAVNCDYCSTEYAFTPTDLKTLL